MKATPLILIASFLLSPLLSAAVRVFSDDFEARNVVYQEIIQSGPGIGSSLFYFGDGSPVPTDEDGDPLDGGAEIFPDLFEADGPFVIGGFEEQYAPGKILPNFQSGLRWRTSDVGADGSLTTEADLNTQTPIAQDAANFFGLGTSNQFIFYGGSDAGNSSGYRLQQRSYDEGLLDSGVITISFLIYEPNDTNEARCRLRLRGDNFSDIFSLRIDDGLLELDSGAIGTDTTGIFGENTAARITLIYNFRGAPSDPTVAITYPTPSGGSETLPGHRVDVWINNVLEMDDVMRGSPSADTPVRLTFRDSKDGSRRQLIFLDDWQVFNGAIVPQEFARPVPTAPIVSVAPEGDNYRLSFETEEGFSYRAEALSALGGDGWVPVGDRERGTGDSESVLVPFGANPDFFGDRTFYRVRVLSN